MRPVYEGMAMPGDVTGKDTNPRLHGDKLALLEKSSFIDDENRVIVRERLKRIVPHDIA